MNLLFFQNCISPHQYPYIKELPFVNGVTKVILVAPQRNLPFRNSMGWENQDIETDKKVSIIIKPTMEDIILLYKKYENEETYCVYSGLDAFKEVFRWFRASLPYKVTRGIITELPNLAWYKPLPLHFIRFKLTNSKYVQYIKYIFAFGDKAVSYYRSLSREWRVIPFAYCTEHAEMAIEPDILLQSEPLKLVFVGTLNKNKNVVSILKAVSSIKAQITLGIFGDGPEKLHLEQYTIRHNLDERVHFHGYMKMMDVHEKLSEFDVLVLPSKYDGWGAVVNEGLQNGLYILCSKACGSRTLLVNSSIGRVFYSQKQLKELILQCVRERHIIRRQKSFRMKWADSISGERLALYFVLSLHSQQIEPWKTENI